VKGPRPIDQGTYFINPSDLTKGYRPTGLVPSDYRRKYGSYGNSHHRLSAGLGSGSVLNNHLDFLGNLKAK
jgi:hypothetical protein